MHTNTGIRNNKQQHLADTEAEHQNKAKASYKHKVSGDAIFKGYSTLKCNGKFW